MPRRPTPDHLLSDKQKKRRIRNERYRANKTDLIETKAPERPKRTLQIVSNSIQDSLKKQPSLKPIEHKNTITVSNQSDSAETLQGSSYETHTPAMNHVQAVSIPETIASRTTIGITKVLASLLIFTAIIAILIFLVTEQGSYFVASGYSNQHALFVSILVESVLVILSFASSLAQGRIWKMTAGGLLAVGVYLVGNVVSLSVENRSAEKANKSAVIRLLDKDIAQIEEQSKIKLANIAAYPAASYPTKREKLLAEYQTSIAGPLGAKLREKSAAMTLTHQIFSGETNSMKYLRWFFLLVNIFLAHLLIHVWNDRGARKSSNFSPHNSTKEVA